jgi:3-hydroxyisobutyrate dehydrogenase-like beta-hydroxyacid dehydrogenase
MEIGFIGLGNMGFPMASRLLEQGNAVIAFDTNDAALDRIVALGGAPRRRRRPSPIAPKR